MPADAVLEFDLISFARTLAKLYWAQDRGTHSKPPSLDALALHEQVERFVSPLNAPPQGQGWGLPAHLRKVVELHAMHRATEWLTEEGFEFEDVSTCESCDFRASRFGADWIIEVKGTTGGPGSVFLTRNEVKLHRSSYPQNALLVVHGIILSKDGASATGGEVLAFCPWQLEEDCLSPIAYEYRLA